MFTGIIQTQGSVQEVRVLVSGGTIFVVSASSFFEGVKKGDSICVDGVCVTALEATSDVVSFEAMPETLRLTTFLRLVVGASVNLERSLRVGDPLGGHLLLGHVDGMGEVRAVVPDGEYIRLDLTIPDAFRKFLAYKGTIAINGVSLTIAETTREGCVVALISHTRVVTNLGKLRVGDAVNFEVDMLARYVDRLLQQFLLSSSSYS